MSARIDLADRIPILDTLLQRLQAGKDGAGIEAAALEYELEFMRWADKNRAVIRLANQIETANIGHVMPVLLTHVQATTRFAERLDAAARDPIASTVQDTFPGAEIADLPTEGDDA